METGRPDTGSLDPRLAELSHGLQTPLAVLKARVARLRTGTVRDGDDAELESIDACLDSLSRMIADALCAGLARRERIDFSAIVADAAADAEAVAECQGIAFAATLEPGIIMEGYPACLREAVANLLANAIKYMDDGPCREIRVALAAETGDAVLTVTDTGIGIPAADLPRIFDRFYRGARVYGRAPGMGLGLSLVKRAIDLHSARIEVDSTLAVGTKFTLRFPLIRQAPGP